jgi:hypothetical protein
LDHIKVNNENLVALLGALKHRHTEHVGEGSVIHGKHVETEQTGVAGAPGARAGGVLGEHGAAVEVEDALLGSLFGRAQIHGRAYSLANQAYLWFRFRLQFATASAAKVVAQGQSAVDVALRRRFDVAPARRIHVSLLAGQRPFIACSIRMRLPLIAFVTEAAAAQTAGTP